MYNCRHPFVLYLRIQKSFPIWKDVFVCIPRFQDKIFLFLFVKGQLLNISKLIYEFLSIYLSWLWLGILFDDCVNNPVYMCFNYVYMAKENYINRTIIVIHCIFIFFGYYMVISYGDSYMVIRQPKQLYCIISLVTF